MNIIQPNVALHPGELEGGRAKHYRVIYGGDGALGSGADHDGGSELLKRDDGTGIQKDVQQRASVSGQHTGIARGR